MESKPLSRREEEIVTLASEGFTNDGIANKLGISVSTVNNYWVRIRVKTSATSRTAIVAKLIKERAEKALRSASEQVADLAEEVENVEGAVLDLNAALQLLQLAMEHMRSVAWATDTDLRVTIIADGESPELDVKMDWQVGKTIPEIFESIMYGKKAVWCHEEAMKGEPCETRIRVNGDTLLVVVRPIKEDDGTAIGCIGVMTSFPSKK